MTINLFCSERYLRERQIAENLKNAREKTGLSQGKVAKLTNIPKGTLSNYEIGYCIPSEERMEKLASIYGVNKHDLYNGVV